MIVSFTTREGSVYHLDHLKNLFVQQFPVERSGPLWNKPIVVVGKRVEIWTAPENDAGVAKVILTGIVSSREVLIEHGLQESGVLS